MQLSRRYTLLGLGGALCATALPAFAHRQRISITEIEWLEASSELGVTHRLHIHDGITALERAGLIESPDLADLKAQAQLALMIDQQFSLHTAEGRHIHLNILGAETNGNMVFIYQTAKMDAPPKRLRVKNDILQDIFSDQRGHVKIDLPGLKTDLQFVRGDRPKLAE